VFQALEKIRSLRRLENIWIGQKVAVLAVDPSSTISHGSILGIKPAWTELVKKRKHIRPLLLEIHWVV
jgi:putative protein kinase ArgK-like GTPase of G3E family